MTTLRFLSVVCAAALILAAAPTFAAQDDDIDIVGTYLVKGDAGNGKTYEGKVRVTADGDAFKVKWTIAEQTYTGVGIRQGDVLSVGYVSGDYVGVASYRIKKGPRL